MELRHLRYFVAVAELRNFTRAARRLRVAQPALSRQIQDLEDELGFRLFERANRPVALTEAGRAFLPEAQAVLERAREAVVRAQAVAKGQRGEIHAGYAPTPTIELLPCLLHSFQNDAPEVKVTLHDLSTAEMLAGLQDAELDLCLMVKPPVGTAPGLNFEVLRMYPVCCVLRPGHPLARAGKVPLRRMAQEPLLAFPRSSYPDYHSLVTEVFESVGIEPRVLEEHESGPGILAAVESGRGWMLGPSCLAAQVGKRLAVRPLHPAPPAIPVGVAWNPKRVTHAGTRFLSAARALKSPATSQEKSQATDAVQGRAGVTTR